jgi:hypothetical protein
VNDLFPKTFDDPATALQLDIFAVKKDSEDKVLSSSKRRGPLSIAACTVCQTFEVHDWQEAAPLLHPYAAEASKQLSCEQFGWSLNENGLHWRAVYSNALAAAEHLWKIKPYLDCLAAGPANLLLNRIQGGPSSTLHEVEDIFKDLDVVICCEGTTGTKTFKRESNGATERRQISGFEGAFRFDVENDIWSIEP